MFTREILKCPVGNEVLGYRHKGEAAALLCEDCNFVFVWLPDTVVPQAKRKKVYKGCDCHHCRKD